MLDRISAEEFLSKEINKHATDKKWPRTIAVKCYEEHKLDLNTSSGVLNGSNAVENLENNIIFWLIESIDNKVLSKYFTSKEIEIFKKQKTEQNKYTKVFQALKIMSDQWISVLKFEELMQLMQNNKIWYNESVQRPLKKIIRGKDYAYRIDINKQQIANIKKAVLDGIYIPDMITLEIPEEQTFYYNEEKSLLNNTEVDHYYIVDGFHRIRGFQDAYSIDHNILMNIPVMFTYFGTEKSNQYIWQEEQKYPMLKNKISGYNQYSLGVNVANKLNITSIMKGQIGRQNSLIDIFDLSNAINMIFKLDNSDKKEEIKLSREIKEALDIIVESDERLLDYTWSPKFILAFLCAVKLNKINIDFINKLNNSEIKIGKSFNETQVKKMLREGEAYV